MKKAISFFLVLVLSLSLCACGEGDTSQNTTAVTEAPTEAPSVATKEEMLASASAFSCEEFLQDYKDNPVRAEGIYVGQVVKFVGYVNSISKDHIVVLPMNGDYQYAADCSMKVTLSSDGIMALSTGMQVAIVGEIAKLPLVMNTAYTYPVREYVAEQIDYMVEIFGNDDDEDGVLEETDGSFGFFSVFVDAFPLLTGEEIKEELVGTWTIKDKFDKEFAHTFNADGTAITAYKGGEDTCYWLVEGDFLYWGTSNREIDTERNISMKVRRLSENVLIVYESDKTNYDGIAHAVLIKQ